MTITKTLYEKYDEIIKAMKQAYEDSLHQPWCIYCVDINKEDDTIVVHVFSDRNSWIQGYYTIWTCDNEYFNLFAACEGRTWKKVYEEEILPFLNEEEKRKVDMFITEYQSENPDECDDLWTYAEVMDFVENKLPEHWSRYRDKLIQEVIDNTEDDYFTNILDERIAENEYADKMWSDEE